MIHLNLDPQTPLNVVGTNEMIMQDALLALTTFIAFVNDEEALAL